MVEFDKSQAVDFGEYCAHGFTVSEEEYFAHTEELKQVILENNEQQDIGALVGKRWKWHVPLEKDALHIGSLVLIDDSHDVPALIIGETKREIENIQADGPVKIFKIVQAEDDEGNYRKLIVSSDNEGITGTITDDSILSPNGSVFTAVPDNLIAEAFDVQEKLLPYDI